MLAIKNGYVEVVKILLDNGAKVDAVNKRGETALILAFKAIKRNPIEGAEIVSTLLAAGAEITQEDSENHSKIIEGAIHAYYHRGLDIPTQCAAFAEPEYKKQLHNQILRQFNISANNAKTLTYVLNY